MARDTRLLPDDEDRIFLTYLLDGRGDEMVGGIYSYLDITPLGRQEEWEDSPEGYPQGEAHSGSGCTTSTTASALVIAHVGVGEREREARRLEQKL